MQKRPPARSGVVDHGFNKPDNNAGKVKPVPTQYVKPDRPPPKPAEPPKK
jgi:hypothetical protein